MNEEWGPTAKALCRQATSTSSNANKQSQNTEQTASGSNKRQQQQQQHFIAATQWQLLYKQMNSKSKSASHQGRQERIKTTQDTRRTPHTNNRFL